MTKQDAVLVGRSAAALRLGALIRKVGPSNVSVLLQGESGTGKEVVARSLFDMRPLGRFVPVDCSTLSAGIFESELFGHERGSFTGATESRVGLLQTAHGGTAFFDEIGELLPEGQVKLLRVLQEQVIRPVGSNRMMPCSFRVIAATNRNLADEVRHGRFRLDLYYRLNVVTIPIPALREHKEDIPYLIRHFLDRAGSDHRLPPELVSILESHDWPGNIRELENCVARLVALTGDDALHVEDLSFAADLQHLCSRGPSSEHPTVNGMPVTQERCGSGGTLAVEEQRAIEHALAASDGNTTVAARTLGIGRTTLYRKRKHYEKIRRSA